MKTENGNEELIRFGPFLMIRQAKRSGYWCKRCKQKVLSARFGATALQEIVLSFDFWREPELWTKAGVIEDTDSFLGLACGCGTSFLRDQEPLWRITVDAAVENGRQVPVCGWEIEPFN
jgi:hypothetical protein